VNEGEKNMSIERKWFLAIGILLTSVCLAVAARADQNDTTIRWDLIKGDSAGHLSAGGTQSAAAADKSTLALTGSGTFQLGDPEDVTGGGTWSLGTSSGTYQVTRFVRFTFAPCTVPTCVSGFGGTDLVGNDKDSRAGLVVLQIRYSDGSRGFLVVSCTLNGTPASVLEGITASKGFVEFWDQSVNNTATAGTILHIVHGEEH
jgi:hypothetical protein